MHAWARLMNLRTVSKSPRAVENGLTGIKNVLVKRLLIFNWS
jgi:hypothetical protein